MIDRYPTPPDGMTSSLRRCPLPHHAPLSNPPREISPIPPRAQQPLHPQRQPQNPRTGRSRNSDQSRRKSKSRHRTAHPHLPPATPTLTSATSTMTRIPASPPESGPFPTHPRPRTPRPNPTAKNRTYRPPPSLAVPRLGKSWKGHLTPMLPTGMVMAWRCV
ncbi:hypothetical protein BS50DRAFT_191258 [Corynespora cassiicola Philippines]|uniref:Uncharacterized protein n=1 Tax=Corynespora cassiicola Philippines TaxID=1448308 RepID=A0A2T2P7E9_CORCC|nr:hypothetical protein BS50DRAFT_191258 [Corynespora cassiicola Philippines]